MMTSITIVQKRNDLINYHCMEAKMDTPKEDLEVTWQMIKDEYYDMDSGQIKEAYDKMVLEFFN